MSSRATGSSRWYFGTEPLFVGHVDASLEVQIHRQPPRGTATPACRSRAFNVQVQTGPDVRVTGSTQGRAFDEVFKRGRAMIAPPRSQTVLDWRDRTYEFVRVRFAVSALEHWARVFELDLPSHVVLNRYDPLLLEAATGLARAAAQGRHPAYCALLGSVVAYRALLGSDEPQAPAGAPAFSASVRERLSDYIDGHLEDRLPLTVLAAQVGLGSHHFLRRFRTTFGTTPHDYVTERRIERARTLLADASLTVADVAQQAGFSHQGHLSRLFREHTGRTPRDFRKNM